MNSHCDQSLSVDRRQNIALNDGSYSRWEIHLTFSGMLPFTKVAKKIRLPLINVVAMASKMCKNQQKESFSSILNDKLQILPFWSFNLMK